jgi:hypothetical protein
VILFSWPAFSFGKSGLDGHLFKPDDRAAAIMEAALKDNS